MNNECIEWCDISACVFLKESLHVCCSICACSRIFGYSWPLWGSMSSHIDVGRSTLGQNEGVNNSLRDLWFLWFLVIFFFNIWDNLGFLGIFSLTVYGIFSELFYENIDISMKILLNDQICQVKITIRQKCWKIKFAILESLWTRDDKREVMDPKKDDVETAYEKNLGLWSCNIHIWRWSVKHVYKKYHRHLEKML